MSEPCLGCGGQSPLTPEQLEVERRKAFAGLPTAVVQGGRLKDQIFSKLTDATMDDEGVIRYPTDRAVLPPCPPGYEPVDDFTFRPLWPRCLGRMENIKHNADRTITPRFLCNEAKADQYHKFVVLTDCQNCPVRCS